MCGILISEGNDIGRFDAALDLMRHRGPDHGEVSRECGRLLGHRRLSVVDLGDRSNQPFYSEDGLYVLVFNGEIYNYKELAKKHGLVCRTEGDTEVLLLLYMKLGSQCLDELNGMFAFVVLDRRDGSVFAARDRLGIKPLFIDRRRGRFAIASEIAPLLELDSNYEWDEEGLRQYVKLRTCFHGRTLYSGIEQLPPGCYLENSRIHRYWQLDVSAKPAPEDEEIEALLADSVRLRRQADVPVGSYLSGGLDSAIIAGLAGVDDVWSVGFTELNEFDFAQLAADRFGVNHHACVVTTEQFEEAARMMIAKRREPLSVPNEVLIYLMTKEVKHKNTVVLSGEGADELFFGYDRIFRWAAEAPCFDIREFDRFYSYGSHRDDEILDAVLSPHRDNTSSALDVVARFFQLDHLQGLLMRLDYATMLSSVEARVPFVDHRLVERMAGVSADFRMAGGVVKAPLKRIYSALVPEEIVTRKKVGFPVPLKSLPFFESSSIDSEMEQWLKFNLRQLTGSDGLYESVLDDIRKQ